MYGGITIKSEIVFSVPIRTAGQRSVKQNSSSPVGGKQAQLKSPIQKTKKKDPVRFRDPDPFP